MTEPPPVATEGTVSMPSDPRIRALCRPSDYGDLTPRQQKQIDRELNLLGWDGVM